MQKELQHQMMIKDGGNNEVSLVLITVRRKGKPGESERRKNEEQ